MVDTPLSILSCMIEGISGEQENNLTVVDDSSP